MIPQTRFAHSDNVDLAYQVLGEGPQDLVMSLGFASHIDFVWERPEIANFMERLARLGRLVLFDKRGVGLSDRTNELVSLEQRSDDVVAVMDAAGVSNAVMIGMADSAVTALVTAARHSDRVASLVAVAAMAVAQPDEDHPWGASPLTAQLLPMILQAGGWGRALALETFAPEMARDRRTLEWWKRYESMSATPSAAARLVTSFLEVDIRPYLSQVRAPVLLLHDVNSVVVPAEASQWLADHLPNAALRMIDGGGAGAIMPTEPMLDEIEDFLRGTRSARQADHKVQTILVTDVVASTARLARIGDDNWQQVLASHRSAVRRSIARYGGQEIDTAGDGFVIAFALPSAALRCARAMVDEAEAADLQIRAGIHAGEVVIKNSDMFGVAMHIAARVAALAGPGEVLITETVRTLAAGTLLSTEAAGEHELKGVPGPWNLYWLL